MAHPVCPTWLTVQPVFLSGHHVHCQTGHSSRTPCMVAHHQGYRPYLGSGYYFGIIGQDSTMSLRSSGTWIGHLCTQSYEELMEGCGASSGLNVMMGKQGATQMSLGGWVVVQNRKCIYGHLYLKERSSYLFSLSMLTSFGLFQSPSLDKSIIVTLEYNLSR